MNKVKITSILVASLFLVPIQRNINLPTSTSTPTASPTIIVHPNLIKNIELNALKFANKRGEILNVKVTAKDATSITVDNGEVSVKVNIISNTHFRRRFWGKSTLAEIKVGDSVDVIGRWANEGKTEINAVLIRDLSIQARFGVFFGTVKTITDTGFIMTTIHKGDEVVTIDSSTKLINRVQNPITQDDIAIGQTVRVRGLWNATAFTITEVAEIKDFSLPPQPSPSPTP